MTQLSRPNAGSTSMIEVHGKHGFVSMAIGLCIAAVRASLLARVWLLLAVGIVIDNFAMTAIGMNRHAIAQSWTLKLLKHLPLQFHEFVDKAWIGPLGLAAPVLRLFESQNLYDFIISLTGILVTILIWGLIGSAICRIALTRMANVPIPGSKSAVVFAFRMRRAIYGPFATFIGTACILFLTVWLLGKLSLVPLVGPVLEWIVIPIVILPSIMIVMMGVGLFLGWPLIIGAAMAEAEDSFDALSRSQTYLFQAPLSWAIVVKVGIVVQAAAWFFVQFIVWATISLIIIALKGSFMSAPLWSDAMPAPWTLPQFGGDALSSWVSIAQSLAASWPIGFEFAFAAAIYLALRHRVDGVKPSDIYLPSQMEGLFYEEERIY
jgi:hypothetical protein